MAEYKLTGQFAEDRAVVRRAMNDSSLTTEQKQSLVNQHNKMNLDNLSLPSEVCGSGFDKYVLSSNFEMPGNIYTYAYRFRVRTIDDDIQLCDAQLFSLKRRNKELFARIDPLVHSKNIFGAKKRAEALAAIPDDVMAQYKELDEKRSKLTEKLKALKKERKEQRKD